MHPRQLNYKQGYAVIRVDNFGNEAHVDEYTVNGETLPAAGPGNVTVKEIVFDACEAQSEVMRLNNLNSDKNCRYYWQSRRWSQPYRTGKLTHVVRRNLYFAFSE